MAKLLEYVLPKTISAIGVLLLCVFVFCIFLTTLLRYVFDAGFVKLNDIVGYSFSALVLVSILVAFFKNKHVKVDFMSSMRAIFEGWFARIFSALPFFVIAFLALPTVSFSWQLLEGSQEPDGLGGYFLIKTLLPIIFCLIALFLWFGEKDKQE